LEERKGRWILAGKKACFQWKRIFLAAFVLFALLLSSTSQNFIVNLHAIVHAQPVDPPATIAPSKVWGALFGTSGDVEIDVNRTGIAVRVEIPREFLPVGMTENDTHFIESNIRNDYYYYSVIDEKNHWSYDWRGSPSDGPCFKPEFSLRDANAPWCVEIWDYLNGTFRMFTPPKFVRFHDLNAPSIAGNYNFTLFVADHTNSLGLPDFVHAWNTTFNVPVSMRDRPASIAGTICDDWFSTSVTCGGDHIILGTRGVAYAKDLASGQIVGRSFVNETTGQFNITGLASKSPPGYQILASAGFDPTYDTAYLLTAGPVVPSINPGDASNVGSVGLARAPQVCGSIDYQLNGGSLAHPLTDHPYLPATGLKVLNVTVEATDSQQHVFRNVTLSRNAGLDDFRITTGSNVTYVGTDPYGTEFAGLPYANSTNSYVLTLQVWVTGYLQVNLLDSSPLTVTVTVSASPSPGGPPVCPTPFPNPIPMQVGGAISGTVQLWNGQTLETPNQAERSLPLPLPPTDALFGGNVLIQAYDHLGILRAVSVINGTYANGTTIYRDNSSIPFILFGFNEYLNHTWSGVWSEHDYGLPPDQAYSIQVFIRGYQLQTLSSISLSLAANATATVKMLRGGAFQVGVFSFDNRLGTRALQAPLSFKFLNLAIPVRARTYFYDSNGVMVGYVECIIRTGVPQPDRLCSMGIPDQPASQQNSFTVVFAGQNWNLHEIWFYGDTPSHVTNDTYTVKTYTLGYVWQHGPSQSPNNLLGFAQLAVTLFFGNEIDITGPVFVASQILGTLPENGFAIGQALLNGGLLGAVPGNFTEGTSTLSFSIFGFGGMTNSTRAVTAGVASISAGKLEGQGHFFYVAPDGSLNFDYGLDNATYTAQVPEFGFVWHFMQPVSSSTIAFHDLSSQTGVIMADIQMARVLSDPLVEGNADLPTLDVAPLTWVQVTGSNSTLQRSVTTLDGRYAGPGALFLPAGTYAITFSQTAYYTSQTRASLQVQWGATYVVDPPNGALCPILPPAVTGC